MNKELDDLMRADGVDPNNSIEKIQWLREEEEKFKTGLKEIRDQLDEKEVALEKTVDIAISEMKEELEKVTTEDLIRLTTKLLIDLYIVKSRVCLLEKRPGRIINLESPSEEL